MHILMVVLRLSHILLGVFWAGTVFFMALFLEPSMRASQPESGKVMLQLQARRLLQVLPAAAVLTILSGLVMFWLVSGGLNRSWLVSGMGHTLSIGAAAALLAYGIGIGVMRPAQLKMLALGQALAKQAGPPSEAQQAELGVLRRRATVSLRWVASLLAAAVVAMAIARYV